MAVVSAFSLAGVAFGFQEKEKAKDKKAPAAEAGQAEGESGPVGVTLRGSFELVSVCDVRCEVSSTDKGGVPIRKIVAEGTMVKKGQVLVEFETGGLEEQQVRQHVACNTAEAGVIRSQSEYEVAVIEMEYYTDGAFPIAKLEMEGAIFVAKESLRVAEEELKVTEEATETGRTPKSRLPAAKFAVEKAKRELVLAETRLVVLEKYEYEKTQKRLRVGIKTAEARLKAEEHAYRLERERFERMGTQIEKCIVKAPAAGRVVHTWPNPVSVIAVDGRPVMKPGTRIRKGRPILSIHDPKKMRIRALTRAADALRLKKGDSATIRVDAFPDMELKGSVEAIAEVRTSPRSPQGPMRRITVGVEDPPEGLRTGMTGEVKIWGMVKR